ncbi:hypothetical protein A2X44_01815 [candidate division CPR3 bacterium GWF2_35_18]|uniref:ATP synthase epsilon chain n=1 Tax=candidate division CPR3 bacterium GW2011_GWF2_35_18 TaxID=1618350 RepID=A0A0G0ERG3_UNCC3|nr:MAG: ATP synthase epsilon chain [candidate division CPR3 bacterium GW2011_GWF2_35_18]KKP86841.1 MAG: ATP synthase epsilon chain [candidate division CPR3 bacterium GW2011_GWE2_35_7]OGB62736.1 MAG: hypothetical protein A2X44_01815 [candidate division CPR3 bacterium GWF2_35_18]OGB65762.1 MAG: hypothetical protein A2250_02075 [candidate division CPR3 bacterium RIFOXYA2_FULL_35_13]OGB79245.1 MAG: hypothetical protein A2296_01035 [candidate division CPR3 bacterium RIFOXYB2_FULL_35_8]OGB80528.1 MA
MGKIKTFKLKILSEEGPLLNGECEVLFIPTTSKEEIAILPYHTPLISIIGKGKVKVRRNNKIETIVEIKSGILYVENNEASVLVNA